MQQLTCWMMLPHSISQACSTTGARTFSRQRPSLCGALASALPGCPLLPPPRCCFLRRQSLRGTSVPR